MRQGLNGVALLGMCAGAIAYAWHTPAVVPATAPASDFSAARAMTHVRRQAAQPRPAGSEGHRLAREYLLGELRSLGLLPDVQDVTGVGTRYPVAGRVRNIVARMPGSRPGGPAVLLAAHYDGVAAGPAAGDDASGTAAILETVRALDVSGPLAHDVIVLLTDAEESGLLGAAAFVREHPWAKDVAFILNIEARGVNGPSLMFETGPGNLDAARVLRAAGGARATSLSTAVYRRLSSDSDLSELSQLGSPAMNFAFIGGVDRYHTSEDDTAHLDPGSLQHHGNQALAVTRALAAGPLPRPATPDAVFFFVPAIGLVVYPEAWALPLSIAGLALAVTAVARRLRTPSGVSSLIVGAATGLSAPVVGAAVGLALGAALTSLHLWIGSGSPRRNPVYAAGIALVVAGCVMAVHGFAARRRDAAAVEAGTLGWWSAVSVALTVVMAGASFVVTWPVLAAIVAHLVATQSVLDGRIRELTRWAAASVAIALTVPIAYLMVTVALGLDAIGGALIGVFVALMMSLVAPLIVPERASGWRGAVVGAGAGMALLVAGALGVRTDAERPMGATIAYAVDPATGKSWLTGSANGTDGARWVDAVLSARGSNTRAVDLPPWLRRQSGNRHVVSVPAPTLPTAAPSGRVTRDSSNGERRAVTVRVVPGVRALSIGLVVDGARVVNASVDDRAIRRDRYRSPGAGWSLEYVAPPDSGFTLALTMERGGDPVLDLTARVPGVSAMPGERPLPRPAGVLPVQRGDLTLVHSQLRLAGTSHPR